MKLFVNILKARLVHMGVDLRRDDIRVPQKLLHDAKVRSVLQQMRGKRVPQDMRVDLFPDPGFFGVFFYHRPDRLP